MYLPREHFTWPNTGRTWCRTHERGSHALALARPPLELDRAQWVPNVFPGGPVCSTRSLLMDRRSNSAPLWAFRTLSGGPVVHRDRGSTYLARRSVVASTFSGATSRRRGSGVQSQQSICAELKGPSYARTLESAFRRPRKRGPLQAAANAARSAGAGSLSNVSIVKHFPVKSIIALHTKYTSQLPGTAAIRVGERVESQVSRLHAHPLDFKHLFTRSPSGIGMQPGGRGGYASRPRRTQHLRKAPWTELRSDHGVTSDAISASRTMACSCRKCYPL